MRRRPSTRPSARRFQLRICIKPFTMRKRPVPPLGWRYEEIVIMLPGSPFHTTTNIEKGSKILTIEMSEEQISIRLTPIPFTSMKKVIVMRRALGLNWSSGTPTVQRCGKYSEELGSVNPQRGGPPRKQEWGLQKNLAIHSCGGYGWKSEDGLLLNCASGRKVFEKDERVWLCGFKGFYGQAESQSPWWKPIQR